MALVVSEPLTAYPSVSLPLLTVERLGVRFGSFRALDDVDFEIRAGELVALAGENGAGKSTLVRCIAGDIAPSERRRSSSRASGSARTRRPWHGAASPSSGRTSRCATTSTSPPTCCSATRTRGHAALGRRASTSRPRLPCSRAWASRCTTRRAPSARCRAASASCSRWRGRWRDRPRLLILDEPTAVARRRTSRRRSSS